MAAAWRVAIVARSVERAEPPSVDYSLEVICPIGALSLIERTEGVVFILIMEAVALIVNPDLVSLTARFLAQWAH